MKRAKIIHLTKKAFMNLDVGAYIISEDYEAASPKIFGAISKYKDLQWELMKRCGANNSLFIIYYNKDEYETDLEQIKPIDISLV